MEAIIFWGIPAAVFIWFAVCIVRFIKCPADNIEKKRVLRGTMVVSGVISGILIAIIAGLMWLMWQIAANM